MGQPERRCVAILRYDENGELVLTSEALTFISSLPPPLFAIVLCGPGRVGKSKTGNMLAAKLGGSEYAALFKVSNKCTPETVGVDAVAVPHQQKGTWIIFDCEGLYNGSTHHAELMAIATQIAASIVYLDRTINERTLADMAEMVAHKVSIADDSRWPSLHVVQNMDHLDNDNDNDDNDNDNDNDNFNNVPVNSNSNNHFMNLVDEEIIHTCKFQNIQSFSLPDDRDTNKYSKQMGRLVSALNKNTTALKDLDGVFDGAKFGYFLQTLMEDLAKTHLVKPPPRIMQLVNGKCEHVIGQIIEAHKQAQSEKKQQLSESQCQGNPTNPAASLREWNDSLVLDAENTFNKETSALAALCEAWTEPHRERLANELAYLGSQPITTFTETKVEVSPTYPKIVFGHHKGIYHWIKRAYYEDVQSFESQSRVSRCITVMCNGKCDYAEDWTLLKQEEVAVSDVVSHLSPSLPAVCVSLFSFVIALCFLI